VQLLVDVSPGYDEVPAGVRRSQYEIARSLLADADLHAVPVVVRDEQIYAIEPARVASIFAEPAYFAPERSERRVPPPLAWAGRRMLGLVPQRARPEARQSLLHARGALAAVLHTPEVDNAPRPERFSIVVHPTRDHVVWTCEAHLDWAPLRQLAEAKQAHGFRVVSLFYGGRAAQDIREACGVDLLDASDVILCTSNEAQVELTRLAFDTDRHMPPTHVVDLDADSVVAEIRSIL
jgi:hypothetical protein